MPSRRRTQLWLVVPSFRLQGPGVRVVAGEENDTVDVGFKVTPNAKNPSTSQPCGPCSGIWHVTA
jgi:hypothetical protein